MGGKNKDHKARDWHTISRRGPAFPEAWRRIPPLHDLLYPRHCCPRGRQDQRSGTLQRQHFRIINTPRHHLRGQLWVPGRKRDANCRQVPSAISEILLSLGVVASVGLGLTLNTCRVVQ